MNRLLFYPATKGYGWQTSTRTGMCIRIEPRGQFLTDETGKVSYIWTAFAKFGHRIASGATASAVSAMAQAYKALREADCPVQDFPTIKEKAPTDCNQLGLVSRPLYRIRKVGSTNG